MIRNTSHSCEGRNRPANSWPGSSTRPPAGASPASNASPAPRSLQGHDLFLEAQQDAEGALYLDLVLPQTTRLAGLTDDAVETIPLRLSFDLGSARELVETITDWLDCNDPTARSRTVDPIR